MSLTKHAFLATLEAADVEEHIQYKAIAYDFNHAIQILAKVFKTASYAVPKYAVISVVRVPTTSEAPVGLI